MNEPYLFCTCGADIRTGAGAACPLCSDLLCRRCLTREGRGICPACRFRTQGRYWTWDHAVRRLPHVLEALGLRAPRERRRSDAEAA